METFFDNRAGFESYIYEKGKGFLVVAHQNCDGYDGMVLAITIVFDTQKISFELNLEWMCFGLDFYGDTLQESLVYQFETLESILDYLGKTYKVNVTDIPIKYQIDQNKYPNPLREENKKPHYQAAWKKFQADFRKGKFLDKSLKLVYQSD